MHLVQLLLPTASEYAGAVDAARCEIIDKFGGVTIYRSAPAEGLWRSGDNTDADDIILVEVMVDTIDKDWWAAYRKRLERRFNQAEIVIRSFPISRL